MTLPPNIRLNLYTPFPSLVQGSGPVTVGKQNGVWTLGFSIAQLGIQNPPPLGSWNTDYALVWDNVVKQFIQVPLGSILYTAGRIRLVAKTVNFNAGNTDTQIPVVLPSGISRYVVESVRISGASQTLTTATCGMFTAAALGGQQIVGTAGAANAAITVNTAATDTNNNTQALTVNNAGTEAYNDATLFFRVGTAQGAPATADVIVTIIPLS